MKIWALYCVLIFTAGTTFWLQYQYVEKVETENRALRDLILPKLQIIEGKTGLQMATAPVAAMSRETFDQLVKEEITSLKSEFGTKLNRIEQFQRISTQTTKKQRIAGRDTVLVIERPGLPADTVVARLFKARDRYFQRSDTLVGDTLRTGVDFRQDLKVAIRKGKREKWWKFWKKRPLEGQLFTADSSTRIKEFQILKVIE